MTRPNLTVNHLPLDHPNREVRETLQAGTLIWRSKRR